MSLLLDARKKSQQAQAAQGGARTELSLEEHPNPVTPKPDPLPIESARSAGQNLFAAKSTNSRATQMTNQRNLLIVLGSTVLLLTLGAAYWWYSTTSSNTTPLQPVSTTPRPALAQPAPIATILPVVTNSGTDLKPTPDNDLRADKLATPDDQESRSISAETRKAPAKLATARAQRTGSNVGQQERRTALQQNTAALRIEQPQAELADPLLVSAYQAYRNGRIDEAQQLYLSMYKRDAHNSDALLGLAAIAQQRNDPQTSAQYYSQVLTLDPRNALANAGMSALSNDVDNNESRLKTLLREQGNSAALHFALGNLYAGQSRWSEAQQAYFNAYTLDAENSEFAFNLAVSLDHLGQRKLAALHYQRALQLDSSNRAGFDHDLISRRAQELAR